MNRSYMLGRFGAALAPVLHPDEIPDQLVDVRSRFALTDIGIPTSIGDAVMTNVYGMRPLREKLGGVELPAWARSDNVLALGLFLDGFLCLDGKNGSVLLLTRELEEVPVKLASDLYVFTSILARVSETATSAADLDITALIEQIDPSALSSSPTWEMMVKSLG
ncbi:SUKH-4 family immunity protein [Streptomyces sp. NBC_01511]|uniref:SUKH-4 family immunity protein n=1 Tax=Streptomyces sp. NBC_01511 TaxID=2903889 RepID=UPI00386D6AEC